MYSLHDCIWFTEFLLLNCFYKGKRHRLTNIIVKRLSHTTNLIFHNACNRDSLNYSSKKAIITTAFFILFGALNYSNIAEGQLKWKQEHADPVHYALLNVDLWFNICFPTAMTMCYYLDRGP